MHYNHAVLAGNIRTGGPLDLVLEQLSLLERVPQVHSQAFSMQEYYGLDY